MHAAIVLLPIAAIASVIVAAVPRWHRPYALLALWAPAPLRRFHQRFGLHEAPAATTTHIGEPSSDLGPTTEDTEPAALGEPVGAGSGTMLQ